MTSFGSEGETTAMATRCVFNVGAEVKLQQDGQGSKLERGGLGLALQRWRRLRCSRRD